MVNHLEMLSNGEVGAPGIKQVQEQTKNKHFVYTGKMLYQGRTLYPEFIKRKDSESLIVYICNVFDENWVNIWSFRDEKIGNGQGCAELFLFGEQYVIGFYNYNQLFRVLPLEDIICLAEGKPTTPPETLLDIKEHLAAENSFVVAYSAEERQLKYQLESGLAILSDTGNNKDSAASAVWKNFLNKRGKNYASHSPGDSRLLFFELKCDKFTPIILVDEEAVFENLRRYRSDDMLVARGPNASGAYRVKKLSTTGVQDLGWHFPAD
jgi:hypothetical protein